MFFHERENWPNFHWDSDAINTLQLKAMHRLGYLAGRMASIGFDNQIIATVEAVTNDVVASSEIEGVRLDTEVMAELGVPYPTGFSLLLIMTTCTSIVSVVRY